MEEKGKANVGEIAEVRKEKDKQETDVDIYPFVISWRIDKTLEWGRNAFLPA